MFKDAKEELQRLEKALLEKEDETMEIKLPPQATPEEDDSGCVTDEALAQFLEEEDDILGDILDDEELRRLLSDTQTIGDPESYQNFSNSYGQAAPPAYNSDKTDLSPEELSDALQEEAAPRSLLGLVLLALFLLLGILLVLAWWLFRLWGIL